jgi:hypothetical protein
MARRSSVTTRCLDHLLEEADGQGNALVDYIYLGRLPVATISPADGQIFVRKPTGAAPFAKGISVGSG